jgi:hypothetical protein
MSKSSHQNDLHDRVDLAAIAYKAKFGEAPLYRAAGVSLAHIAMILENAVAKNQPLPPNHSWYSDIHPGTAA